MVIIFTNSMSASDTCICIGHSILVNPKSKQLDVITSDVLCHWSCEQ